MSCCFELAKTKKRREDAIRELHRCIIGYNSSDLEQAIENASVAKVHLLLLELADERCHQIQDAKGRVEASLRAATAGRDRSAITQALAAAASAEVDSEVGGPVDGARDRLAELEEQERQRTLAKCQLQVAVAGRSVKALSCALADAAAAGVEIEAMAGGYSRLDALKEEEAELVRRCSALEKGVVDADVAAMRRAVEEAGQVASPPPQWIAWVLLVARWADELERHEQAKSRAESALLVCVSEHDRAALARAIGAAEAAGVHTSSIARGEMRLQGLEEIEERRVQTLIRLRFVTAAMDTDAIRKELSSAEGADESAPIVAEAKNRLQSLVSLLEAMDTAVFAGEVAIKSVAEMPMQKPEGYIELAEMLGESQWQLEKALRMLEDGVLDASVARRFDEARETKSKLVELQQCCAATAALEAAVLGSDIKALFRTIGVAAACDVPISSVRRARDKLAELCISTRSVVQLVDESGLADAEAWPAAATAAATATAPWPWWQSSLRRQPAQRGNGKEGPELQLPISEAQYGQFAAMFKQEWRIKQGTLLHTFTEAFQFPTADGDARQKTLQAAWDQAGSMVSKDFAPTGVLLLATMFYKLDARSLDEVLGFKDGAGSHNSVAPQKAMNAVARLMSGEQASNHFEPRSASEAHDYFQTWVKFLAALTAAAEDLCSDDVVEGLRALERPTLKGGVLPTGRRRRVEEAYNTLRMGLSAWPGLVPQGSPKAIPDAPCLFFSLNLEGDQARKALDAYSNLKAGSSFFFASMRSASLHPGVALRGCRAATSKSTSASSSSEYSSGKRTQTAELAQTVVGSGFQVLVAVEGLKKAVPLWHCSPNADELEALIPCLTRCVLQCDPVPNFRYAGFTFLYVRLRYEGSDLDEVFLETVRSDLRHDDDVLTKYSKVNLRFSQVKQKMFDIGKWQEDVQMATEVLRASVIAGDASALVAAIEEAESVGVDAAMVDMGKQRLVDVKEAEERHRLAAHTLAMACEGSALQPLQQAIWVAQTAGVSADDVERGKQRLAQLAQQRVKREFAKTVLQEFSQLEDRAVLSDCAALQRATESAEAAGVDQLIVGDSKDRLRRLERSHQEVSSAAAALGAAMVLEEPTELERAVNAAARVGVDGVLVELGGQRLATMLQAEKQRKVAYAGLLSVSAGCGDLGELRAAIRQAEKEGVDAAAVEVCVARLGALERLHLERERALAVLESVARSSDAALLRQAVEGAELAGVEAHAVAEVKARAAELDHRLTERESVVANLLAAAQDGDANLLEQALASAEASGLQAETTNVARGLTRARLKQLQEIEQWRLKAELASKSADDQRSKTVVAGHEIVSMKKKLRLMTLLKGDDNIMQMAAVMPKLSLQPSFVATSSYGASCGSIARKKLAVKR